MTVAIKQLPVDAPSAAPSLWQLGVEAQELNSRIAALALMLDDEDEVIRASAIEELEGLLEADSTSKAALERKGDAYCWVIENLRAQASYRKQQADRLKTLALADEERAQRLEEALVTVLTRLQPEAKEFTLPAHQLRSRRSEAVEIEDEELLPRDLVRVKTSTSPDKTEIKKRIKAGDAIPGARLENRVSWTIR
jgi:hypothetical protein